MSTVTRTFSRVILAAMAIVLVLGAVIPAMAATPTLRPAISLGPLNHREELRATVHARAKLAHVELRMDNKKVQPWVKAHAGWTYTVSYPLKKLSTGMHTAKLTVRDEKNRTTQRQWQFQKLAQLALNVDRSSVLPNERVTLTGQGFTPGTAITVGMGGLNTGVGGTYGKATADGSGAFIVQVSLDRFPNGSPLHAGTITLLAHNSDGSEKAAAEVRILPDPRMALDKNSIKPGDTVRVTGEGFTPGVGISISLGAPNTGAGGNYGTAVTDSTGTFALSVRPMQLPDGSPLFAGSMILVAHTADSAEKATAQLQILADPTISLNTSAIKAGEKVTVTGKGFTPGASVSIALGGVNTGASGNYGSAIVDAAGRLSLDVTLARYPDGSPLAPGAIVLLAHTADFAERATAQLQVQANPSLAASKTTLRAGETVVLTGDGFTPGKSVSIRLAGIDMGHGNHFGSAAVDANGRFSFQLPLARYPDGTPLPPGGMSLMALTADGEQALVGLQILDDPAISLSKGGIKPGEQIVITGQGFTPFASISISAGPVNGPGGNYGNATANSNGRFSLPVTLARYPDGSQLKPGTIVLLAHTADFSQKASAQLQILADPSIALDRTIIQPGDRVTVTGQGFAPDSTIILSMSLNGAAPIGNYGTVVVDANGRFVLTTRITQYPGGSPLRAGELVMVAHDASWSQRATIQLSVAERTPAVPSDLRIASVTKGATSAEQSAVRLQWLDNASNVTGFRIQATFTRMNGGADTQTWQVAANATTANVRFVAGGINPVTTVCFTVTAFNAQGDSPPSNQACAVL